MRTQCFFVTMLLAVCPVAAASTTPIGWQKSVVPETGANVDFPTKFLVKTQAGLIGMPPPHSNVAATERNIVFFRSLR